MDGYCIHIHNTFWGFYIWSDVFLIIGIKKAKAEIETGAKKPLGIWFEPMAKYVFVLLTLIVLVGGGILGGIG